jgi:hypothetical protein
LPFFGQNLDGSSLADETLIRTRSGDCDGEYFYS